MSVVALADARARVPTLPADDGVAQDIIDEQEAWLARRIGLLEGERTETFYVGGLVAGTTSSIAKLGLSRYTDSVALRDNGRLLTPDDDYRLVDRGSAVALREANPSAYWTGPYVAATYTPNDLAEVKAVIYNLLALAGATGTPENGVQSETIGAYSYTRGAGSAAGTLATRAALASSLLPKRPAALTVFAIERRLGPGDPVINAPEPVS